jgi:hypothetical protein
MSDPAERRPVPNAAGRNKLLRALRADGTTDGPVSPQVARLFGGLYEDLLRDYFKSQKHTDTSKPVWRYAGEAYRVNGGGRNVRQDFLVTRLDGEQAVDEVNRLTVFEAKSWPAFRNFHGINLKNIDTFL